MGITGGFGIVLDIERGESRRWVMGSDGVKRWADSGLPCEPPSCNECRYCFPDEIRNGDDYSWKDYCNLAEPGGKAIEIDEGECCPDWCPLLQPNTYSAASCSLTQPPNTDDEH